MTGTQIDEDLPIPCPAGLEMRRVHRFAELDQVRLHYVDASLASDSAEALANRPLVVLLHGFPEFWYAWRHQIAALVEHGYRVVAPDLRGYNRSDKPRGIPNYRVETLASDIDQLIASLGSTSATVIGHDWGGVLAYWLAMLHPRRVSRLVVMNAPHPGHATSMMLDPVQLRRSRYILKFQLPVLPERWISARDFAALRRLLVHDPAQAGTFSAADIESYVAALRGESIRAAIDYYRALLRRNPFELRRKLVPIDIPTQVIWGVLDRHLGVDYAEPAAKWVWDLRFDRLEDAGHWVQSECPDRVNELLRAFLPAVRSEARIGCAE